VRAESVELTVAGEIVRDTWAVVERRFPAMALDAHVVMPDHIHAIVWLSLGAGLSLGRVVGTFKGLSARRVNAAWGRVGTALWQRGYHDHVIRSVGELARCRQYVADNPRRWCPVRSS
jgi:putative transposase